MEDKNLIVQGRITYAVSDNGVHGITVELWDKDPFSDDKIGTALTNANGRFRIDFDESSFAEPFEGRPELYLKLRDRDGRVVHITKEQKTSCERGKPIQIDVHLDEKQLADHLAEPLSWQRPEGRLFSGPQFTQIATAVRLLFYTQQFPSKIRKGKYICPLPQLLMFEYISQDARDMLQGDSDAAHRFRQALNYILNEQLANESSSLREFERLLLQEDLKDLRKLASRVPKTRQSDQEVFLEHIFPLLIAAAQLGDGDKDIAARYIAVILDQVCRLELLHNLSTAAKAALSGIERDRAHFLGLCRLMMDNRISLDRPEPDDDFFPDHPFSVDFHPERGGPIDPQVFEFFGTLDCLTNYLSDHLGKRDFPRYTITSITPARACPGNIITIKGFGFWNEHLQVNFGRWEGEGWIEADPLTWSDTEITVSVPEGAGHGIRLGQTEMLYSDTVFLCGRFIDKAKAPDIQQDFEGTAAEILSFRVNEFPEKQRACVRPGAPLDISWTTAAADHLRVEIIDENGTVLDFRDPADASGDWRYTTTSYVSTTRLTVRLTARGDCYPPQTQRQVYVWITHPPRLVAQGMEITQAIQYYRADQHLDDDQDRGADNSIRLVAYKPAWVRVYVRSGQDSVFDNGQLPNVTGTLTIKRQEGDRWQEVTELSPIPPGKVTAEANPDYKSERGNINATLNFVIPYDLMLGRLWLTARVYSSSAPCGGNESGCETVIDLTFTQMLHLAGIMVGYNGPNAIGTANLNLAAPTLDDLRRTSGWLHKIYPIWIGADSRIAGTIRWNLPLNDPLTPGSCTQNWDRLMERIREVATADGNDHRSVYYGLLPIGIPMGPVVGCGGGGIGVGEVNDGTTMAEEVGHAVGLDHAPCGGAASPDPDFPAYEPYDASGTSRARIGEFGLDIDNGTIYTPDSRDFMGYCSSEWISIYHYNRLLDIESLNPGSYASVSGNIAPKLRSGQQPEPLISIVGSICEEDKVAVSTVMRLETRPHVVNGQPTELVAELLDEFGTVLSWGFVVRLSMQPSKVSIRKPGKASFLFQALFRDPAPGAVLQIRRGTNVLWQRHAPAQVPVLDGFTTEVSKDNKLSLSWVARMAESCPVEVWIQYSTDMGKTWKAFTVGLRSDSAEFDINNLPAGKLIFRALLSDGFSTAVRESEAVILPTRAPSAAILHPQGGGCVKPDGVMRFYAIASSCTDETLSNKAYKWILDSKEIGSGKEIWVDTPKPGLHEAKLIVTDEYGSKEIMVRFEVKKS